MTMHLQSDSGLLIAHNLLSFKGNSEMPYRGIESLPPEIISHIFIIGSDQPRCGDLGDFGESSNNDDIDNDEGEGLMHFATLCSYVCQRWRNIALGTCQLWSSLIIDGTSGSLEKARVWISRSKDVPLAIRVDLTLDEHLPVDEEPGSEEAMMHCDIGYHSGSRSRRILRLILPYVLRWKRFVLQTDSYDIIWVWQSKLALVQSAPVLEHIGIFCYTEWLVEDVYHTAVLRLPQPPFPEGTPNIRSVALWGVHFDWKSVTFFAGLESLHLAWHTKDVRPTTEQFVRALSQSPKLETLNLEGSAPLPGTWPQGRILLPNLRRFGLVQIDLSDAVSVVDHIDFPALTSLKLDLEEESVEPLIRAFCQTNKSRLESLQILRIASFQCLRNDGELFLSTLVNVKSMILDFNFLPSHFCDTLTSSPLVCPRLEMVKLSGLTAMHVKALIKARKKSSTPIRCLYIDEDDDFSVRAIEWLRREVETVEFFENSDVENGSEEDDEEDEWTDDTKGSDETGETKNDYM